MNDEGKSQIETEINNHSKEIKSDPVIHYSRERRLSHASPMVRSMNEDGLPARKGFAKILFGSSSNAIVFGCIIMICVVIFLYSRPLARAPDLILGGNILTLEVELDDGINYLLIDKNATVRGEVYLGPVEITVTPAISGSEETTPGYSNWLTFNPVDSEFFKIPLLYEASAFFVILKAGDNQLSVRVEAVRD